jgi:hypothetical protein
MSTIQLRSVTVCALALLCSACSFIFVERPLSAARGLPERPGPCTSSKALPAVDMVIAGVQLLGVGIAASANESDYERSPISRKGDIALGAALATLFATSAVYGFTFTSRCAELKEHRVDDYEFMKRELPCSRVPYAASPSHSQF